MSTDFQTDSKKRRDARERDLKREREREKEARRFRRVFRVRTRFVEQQIARCRIESIFVIRDFQL
jgi:hypothetical protein